MKGLFIPEITAEMFRNGCLESIEALIAEGEIYDIDYSPWIPVMERLPDSDDVVLTCYKDGSISTNWVCVYDNIHEWVYDKEHVVAWMPLPEPWEGEV